MPTVFSKFVDGEISPKDPQPAPAQGHDEKLEVHTQLLNSDEPQMTQAVMEQLKAREEELTQAVMEQLKAHEEELKVEQLLRSAQLAAVRQRTTIESRVPELLNPQSIQAERELPEPSQFSREHFDMTQKPDDWADKQAGLTLGNGQLRLKIQDWRTPIPQFVVENNPEGSPKCDLDAVVADLDLIRVDFKIPRDYPEGMTGIMRSIEALFLSPKKIGMRNIETGSAPALRELKNPKRDSYYIKWTTPWETSGCRVSWMKAKEKSPTLKFKFVNSRNAKRVEQMMVTVDERDGFYQKISKKDPVSIQTSPTILGSS